jgi:hypothetical protein
VEEKPFKWFLIICPEALVHVERGDGKRRNSPPPTHNLLLHHKTLQLWDSMIPSVVDCSKKDELKWRIAEPFH